MHGLQIDRLTESCGHEVVVDDLPLTARRGANAILSAGLRCHGVARAYGRGAVIPTCPTAPRSHRAARLAQKSAVLALTW